jgi:hypothetical protein
MTEPTVNVETEVRLTEAFKHETPVGVDESHNLEPIEPRAVSLDPNGACWWSHEFELGDTPWRVYNVSVSENGGVEVKFKRDGK